VVLVPIIRLVTIKMQAETTNPKRIFLRVNRLRELSFLIYGEPAFSSVAKSKYNLNNNPIVSANNEVRLEARNSKVKETGRMAR
jgi:hypothetical protein